MAISDNVKRGSIEIIILSILSDEDMYGYQLSQEIFSRSGGLYSMLESSMYPTLYRLVDKGMISDRQVKVGKRRVRVYYHIEDKGKEYLKQIREEYLSLSLGIFRILDVKSLEEISDERKDH